MGWAKQIKDNLEEFNLTDDWTEIKNMTEKEWKNKVYEAGEKQNKELLKEECYKCENAALGACASIFVSLGTRF